MARIKRNGAEAKTRRGERRDDSYTFTSARDLMAFFEASLPRDIIRNTMKSVKEEFVRRQASNSRGARLQMLKKCELKLVRLVRQRTGVEREPSGN